MRPLPHPPAAEHDPDALEMIRGWIIDGKLQIALAAWVWEDEPAQWGRMFAEAVGHLSDAVSQETGRPKDEVRRQIVATLQHYLANPVELVGEFVDPVEPGSPQSDLSNTL
jgi:Domain of unknown function (DUF5076)